MSWQPNLWKTEFKTTLWTNFWNKTCVWLLLCLNTLKLSYIVWPSSQVCCRVLVYMIVFSYY